MESEEHEQEAGEDETKQNAQILGSADCLHGVLAVHVRLPTLRHYRSKRECYRRDYLRHSRRDPSSHPPHLHGVLQTQIRHPLLVLLRRKPRYQLGFYGQPHTKYQQLGAS